MKFREQGYYILGALALLAVLFFGFDTKPSTQKTLEKSRVLNAPGFDIQSLQTEAKEKIQVDQLNYVETLESQIQFANNDSVRINLLQQLSGYWYQLGQPLIAGHFAREVAERKEDAESWSITGTTFVSALSNIDIEEKDKLAARDAAIQAFENAISLEPQVVEHRVNQALTYIEFPEQTQPMKGIQMLAALATNYPQSPLPAFHLARLALKTNQIAKAEERIRQALAVDSTNARIACLAVDIYTQAGKTDEARRWSDLCANLK